MPKKEKQIRIKEPHPFHICLIPAVAIVTKILNIGNGETLTVTQVFVAIE
jgi:hypothetical protein